MIKLKFLICVLLAIGAIVAHGPSWAADVSIQIQMLDSTIHKMETEKREKMAELEKCARGVNGFRIAGISTLGLTAVGIGVNVSQASKKSHLNRQIDSKEREIEKRQQEIAALAHQRQAEDAELARLRAERDALEHKLRACEEKNSCDIEEEDADGPDDDGNNIDPSPEPPIVPDDDKDHINPLPNPPIVPVPPVKRVDPPSRECTDGRSESCLYDAPDGGGRGTRMCVNGKWGDCIPDAECADGSTMGCGHGQIKRCINGKWGECSVECADGSTRGCGAGMLQTCVDNRWSDCMPISRSFRDTCEAHLGTYRHDTYSIALSYCLFSDMIFSAAPNRTETQADCTRLCQDVMVGTGYGLGRADFFKGITGRTGCSCYPAE